MKKVIALFLLLAMLLSLCACGGESSGGIGNLDVPGFGSAGNTVPGGDPGNNGGNKVPGGNKTPEVYSKYSNLLSIGQFHNGLASFSIRGENWSKYGYIDIHGNVVIEPIYYVKQSASTAAYIPTFEMPYVLLYSSGGLSTKAVLLNRNGEELFAVGKNNVTGIGDPMNGYFWVESYEEDLSGKTYTVRYYRTTDMEVVATFEKMKAVQYSIVNPFSTVDSTGKFELYVEKGGSKKYNIADYDASFRPAVDTWNVQVESLNSYKAAQGCWYHASDKNNDLGQLATVVLQNKEGTYYYSIVDSKGNVLMEPQQKVTFPVWAYREGDDIQEYDFYRNLCPAQDASSGLWGYVDPYGQWKIQPQYLSATSFTDDGYAIVNDIVVINTDGETVLTPGGETVTELKGYYRLNETINVWSHYITFDGNGTIKYKLDSSTTTGKYTLDGNILTISGLGRDSGIRALEDGTHYVRKEGNKLVIDGYEWILVED